MKQVTRVRTVISGVGSAAYSTADVACYAPGEIRLAFATADATEDAAATVGTTGATDLGVQIKDQASGRVLLEYELTAADPELTIRSEEAMPLRTGSGQLTVGVILDAGGAAGDADVVVELTIGTEQ